MLKLLIAEDELREAKFLRQFVTKLFAQTFELVCVCSDGETAIEEGKKHRPDVVMLDIEMPKVNGLNVAKTLHTFDPTIRFLFLTAHGTFEYAKEAIRIGAEDYLVKPYSEQDLVEALEKVVSKITLQNKREKQELLQEIVAPVQSQAVHPIIKMVMQYIQAHYMEKISLESLSDSLGFSPGYVSKCLKKYQDKSFTNLLMECRIMESAKLLARENLTISEISYAVGFSDPNYFYKCFQKVMGMQPKKFIQSLRGEV
jgi:YesN/AraC family two-component response regulator